jgi:hypothetical protein
LSEKPREVIPTTKTYIAASGKQALMLLQSAAALIPVPLIKEAIGVALNIIQVCEVRKIPPKKKLRVGSQYIIVRIYLWPGKRSKSCKIGYAI